MLRMIRSPLLLSCETARPRTVVDHALKEAWSSLSGGERALVSIAGSFLWPTAQVWWQPNLSVLGSLDKDNRRKVLMVLWYLHMGHDVPISELVDAQFIELFGVPAKLR